MQQEQTNNLAIAHRFMEQFIGANDAAVVDEVVASDVIAITGLSPQGPIQGREAYRTHLRSNLETTSLAGS